MSKVMITFPDGNQKEFDAGVSVAAIAGSISPGLKKRSVAGIVNDELYDFNRPILVDSTVQIITNDMPEAFAVLNHSTAHLLAQAVKRLFPEAKFGVGPAIEEGFYYDIDSGDVKITEEDLPRIEAEMKKVAGEKFEMVRREVSRDEALRIFAGDQYKLELIEAIPDGEVITVYSQGEFTDLCAGGHVGWTNLIKHFKLLSIAGAYWRGDSNNVQLQRIYGTAWFSKEDLEQHLQILEERRERDHRKIGKELELFTFNDLAGKGLAMWLPNGAAIRRELERYIVDMELKSGYQHVYTPVMGSVDLYKTSGHWDHYHEDMFPVMEMENEELVLRPMNCPHHMMIYGVKPRSYRELPIRIGELGTMHRYEKSGALTGLERVRGMCLNDAHLFVRPDQIAEEFKKVLDLIHKVYADLDITPTYYRLSLRDPENKDKYFDDDAMWEQSQAMLRDVLVDAGVAFVEAEDEAAFYGPKLDIQVKSAIGHEFTLSTVQLDFLLPEKFDLTYIGEDGNKHRPVVIHRGVISTMERMTAYLIEEYKGAFPLWLAPTQIVAVPVNNGIHGEYVQSIFEELNELGIRVGVDNREEKMGYKIREAQVGKVPFTLVIGDKEMENNQITYRKYGTEQSVTIDRADFIPFILQQIAEKK
ncbi:threonine--tRNA ligase [Culicoidibacter larvae]|uniref:Threonine--tRNA ligase n=1 Tax=Culicoidibacter larvae TaxID=2579976 RepID=A0A5R8QA84_9FIRM|nr:threonine--tRNA ligase [Culicoidibacter larvae]TLG72501.1 threonine--tRNA ligase [Culicoidibacter larvae]